MTIDAIAPLYLWIILLASMEETLQPHYIAPLYRIPQALMRRPRLSRLPYIPDSCACLSYKLVVNETITGCKNKDEAYGSQNICITFENKIYPKPTL